LRDSEHAACLLRGLQTRGCVNARTDFVTSAQRQQLSCGNPTMEPEINLFKVQWRMSHVTLNEINKLSLL